jgi:hypothetical protein
METSTTITARQPWNKGKLVGQKTPLKLKEIWAIRIRLQIASRCRDLALFNLAVDASSVRAISRNCGCATSATARAWRPAPSSFNRKPADLYSSRLRSRHGGIRVDLPF